MHLDLKIRNQEIRKPWDIWTELEEYMYILWIQMVEELGISIRFSKTVNLSKTGAVRMADGIDKNFTPMLLGRSVKSETRPREQRSNASRWTEPSFETARRARDSLNHKNSTLIIVSFTMIILLGSNLRILNDFLQVQTTDWIPINYHLFIYKLNLMQ